MRLFVTRSFVVCCKNVKTLLLKRPTNTHFAKRVYIYCYAERRQSVGRTINARGVIKSFFFSRVYNIINNPEKARKIPISFHVEFNNRSPEALSAAHKSPFSSDQDKCVYTQKETTLVQRWTASALDGPGRDGRGWGGAGPTCKYFPPACRVIFSSTLTPINHCDKCSEGAFLRLIFATRVHFFRADF